MLKRKLNSCSKRKGEIGQGIGQPKKTFITHVFDIIRETSQPRDKMLKLQHLKAKIIRLHTVKSKSMMINIHDTTGYQGEKISL